VNVLYVYAVTRRAALPECDGVDGSRAFGVVEGEGVAAIYSTVAAAEFSQQAIDARAGDLAWLGVIGYAHQDVMKDLMRTTAVVPLRAFTLFSGEPTVREFLVENGERLRRALDRLDGKQEWTLKIEFDPERWSAAIVERDPVLRGIAADLQTASPGKGFLLRKKMEEEKKRASKEGEQQVVAEIERVVLEKLSCQTIAESRQSRDGAFPQINVLLDRDEESALQEIQLLLARQYEVDGVSLVVSGPWPPYTFAAL
jgi:hypothetical protein